MFAKSFDITLGHGGYLLEEKSFAIGVQFLKRHCPHIHNLFYKNYQGSRQRVRVQIRVSSEKGKSFFSPKISHCLYFVRSKKIRKFSIFSRTFSSICFAKKMRNVRDVENTNISQKKTKKSCENFAKKNAGIMRNNTKISRRNTGDLKYSFFNLLAYG